MLIVPRKHAHATVLDVECVTTVPAFATGSGPVLPVKLKHARMNVVIMVSATKENASAILDTRMRTAVCNIAPKIVMAMEVASTTRAVYANLVMKVLVARPSNAQ